MLLARQAPAGEPSSGACVGVVIRDLQVYDSISKFAVLGKFTCSNRF